MVTVAGTSRSETLISQKIGHVADRIVRGRRAATRPEVTFYRYHTSVTAVLTVLGGMGVTQIKPDVAWFSGSQLLFAGGVLSLALAVVLELYRAFNVQEMAIKALAARDAFTLVLENLKIALAESDPMDQLSAVADESRTLVRSFYKVLSDDDASVQQEVESLCAELLRRYRQNWTLPQLTVSERRSAQ